MSQFYSHRYIHSEWHFFFLAITRELSDSISVFLTAKHEVKSVSQPVTYPNPHLPMIALTFLGMNYNAKLGIYPLKNLPHNHNPVTDISHLSISFMILRNRDKAW